MGKEEYRKSTAKSRFYKRHNINLEAKADLDIVGLNTHQLEELKSIIANAVWLSRVNKKKFETWEVKGEVISEIGQRAAGDIARKILPVVVRFLENVKNGTDMSSKEGHIENHEKPIRQKKLDR